MTTTTADILLQDVATAGAQHDPQLLELFTRLVTTPPADSESLPPDTPTFERFLIETRSAEFRRKSRDEQATIRKTRLAELADPDAKHPLPDRLRSFTVLTDLYHDPSPAARQLLLVLIAELPLVYGPWKGLKQIFKEAEAANDIEIYAALAARFDHAHATGPNAHAVSHGTLGYLARRAWRFLRRTAEGLPASYPDVAVKILANYPETTDWHQRQLWIANHVFFHETKKYSAKSFHPHNTKSLISHRAYAELWKRSPRPLFDLLATACSEFARKFAIESLKADFRTALRDVEPAWVTQLVQVGSGTVDAFVIWLLKNVPRFEQAAFRELGLHDCVLALFDSPSKDARNYAVDYARTHARDLPVQQLIALMQNSQPNVRKLATDLLKERDPRKDVGLDAWGQLLETSAGHVFAEEMLRKHFSKAELTADWFRTLLLAENSYFGFGFAMSELPRLHTAKSLGVDFFLDLLDALPIAEFSPRRKQRTANYAFEQLQSLKMEELSTDNLRKILLNPLTFMPVSELLDSGRLTPEHVGIDFLQALAFGPDWEANAWLQEFRKTGPDWAALLENNSLYVEHALRWLTDARRVDPRALGRDWLMTMVASNEKHYHDFGCELLIKAFPPGDFAPVSEDKPDAKSKSKSKKDAAPPAVDLGGQSFLFTGKMATMQRSEAQKNVRAAGGSVASTVSKTLTYLVIGDEGSPLYGEGRKGSKQTKAESLIEAGAELKIVSETAFLRMLAGDTQSMSSDAVATGCDFLWNMATADGPVDTPLKKFALRYLRMHHPEICLAETDRPVDPGDELPAEWLNFERVQSLFFERRTPLRKFALELARYEFARWSPAMREIIELCESPYAEVREFVALALTADDVHEHRRYRLNPEMLTPDAVYSFCESRDEATRQLGMQLIDKHPRLQLPHELYRLTESPDRRVRAFVVKRLWSLYREQGVTKPWTPWEPPVSQVAAKKSRKTAARDYGPGTTPRPESAPATDGELLRFLKQSLYSLPPGPPAREADGSVQKRMLPLSHGRAKLALVETLRDLAMEDAGFAAHIQPLLTTFLQSGSPSEQAACLVALTRINQAHLAGA